MGRWRSSTTCERVAQWMSLELDGELSEFERAALGRHLSGCAECREARAVIAAFTRTIRETPLAAPARTAASAAAAAAAPGRAQRARRSAAALVLAAAVASLAAVFALRQGAPALSSSALASATPLQRLEFAAAEHARIDPLPFVAATPRPSPFGARVLVESV